MRHNYYLKHLSLIFKKLKVPVLIFLLIPIVISCLKPEDFDFDKLANSNYDGEWAIPLIKSRLTIEDLLSDSNSLITSDANNFLKIFYESDELFSLTAEEVIDIPDQSFLTQDTIIYPVLPPGTGDSIIVTRPFSFTPDTAGQRIDSVFLKSGTLDVILSSDLNHSLQIELRIPSLTKNGKIFSLVLPHNYQGTLPVTVNQSVNLTDYVLTLDNSPGNTNKLFLTYVLFVEGDTNTSNNPYHIDLTANMSGLEFSKFFGFIGQYGFPLSDTINLGAFTSSITGSVMINELKTYINTHNSFGMPMAVEMNHFSTLSSSSSLPVYILPPASQISMPAPTVLQVGQFVDTTYLFDETNSGIVNAINSLPHTILFDINGISNPTNNPANSNFVLDTSRFSVDASIELPLHASISGFVIEDTLDFSFTNIDEIETALFTVISDNGFPITAAVQIYFVNQGYFVLDSLMDAPDIIDAGVVGPAPDLKVISPTRKIVDVMVGRNKLDNLADATKLIIRGTVSTYQSGYVKFYNTDYIDIKVGVKTKFNINF